MSYFSPFALDTLRLLLPTACYPSGLASKLASEALLPFSLVALVLACGYARGRALRLPSAATVGLPAALVLSFLLIPKVSGALFKAWDCAAFAFDDAAGSSHYYLRADPAIRCEDPTYASPEHRRITARAAPLLCLWPIGGPACFMALLVSARRRILRREQTSLMRATAFLHEDYKPHFYFWEPVEMLRRLSITGFVLLLHDAQQRLYAAAMLSYAFVVLLAYLRPYEKPINNLLALGAHLTLLCTIIAGIMLRLCDGVERIASGNDQLLRQVFGFGDTTAIVNTMLVFNFGFLGLIVVASLYQAVHDDGQSRPSRHSAEPTRPGDDNDLMSSIPLMRQSTLEVEEKPLMSSTK